MRTVHVADCTTNEMLINTFFRETLQKSTIFCLAKIYIEMFTRFRESVQSNLPWLLMQIAQNVAKPLKKEVIFADTHCKETMQ